MTLTANGRLVNADVRSIASSSSFGGMFPPARAANAPAFETAATSSGVLTQVIAPQSIGYSVPRNPLPLEKSLSVALSIA